jgi:hypothetical protein
MSRTSASRVWPRACGTCTTVPTEVGQGEAEALIDQLAADPEVSVERVPAVLWATFKAEAAEMDGVLEDLRGSDPAVNWFYVSPAAGFGAWAPGEATGSYRTGGDIPPSQRSR